MKLFKAAVIPAMVMLLNFSSNANDLRLEDNSFNANPVTAETCKKVNIPEGFTLKDAYAKIKEIQTFICGSGPTETYDMVDCQKQLTYWGAVQRCLMLQK